MSRNRLVMNLLKLFKQGQTYISVCVTEKSLSSSFPEIKIIGYLKQASIYLPPFIVALFVWQYYMHIEIAITIVTAIFALSLPLQGVLWLGKRALSPLPLTLLNRYNYLQKRLIEQQIIGAKSIKSTEINFMDFMQLMNLAKNFLSDDDDSENWLDR